MVKAKFLHNIPKLSALIVDKGYLIIRDQILPLISSFFSAKSNNKINDYVFDSFINVSKFINEKDKGEHVLNTVIRNHFNFDIIYFN